MIGLAAGASPVRPADAVDRPRRAQRCPRRLLTPTAQYERDGADLSRRGLYLDLPAVGTRRRRSRLLDVGLGDLADERSPRHVESAVNGAGQRTGVVLEDLDHQRSVVGENHAGLLHAEQARLTLGLAERA